MRIPVTKITEMKNTGELIEELYKPLENNITFEVKGGVTYAVEVI